MYEIIIFSNNFVVNASISNVLQIFKIYHKNSKYFYNLFVLKDNLTPTKAFKSPKHQEKCH